MRQRQRKKVLKRERSSLLSVFVLTGAFSFLISDMNKFQGRKKSEIFSRLTLLMHLSRISVSKFVFTTRVFIISKWKKYIFQMRTLDILKYPLKKTCQKPQGPPPPSGLSTTVHL